MAIAPGSSRSDESSFRSPPETKARSPPPRSTSTETSAASASSSACSSSCAAWSPSALRTCGRSIVTTAIPPSTSNVTSVTAIRYIVDERDHDRRRPSRRDGLRARRRPVVRAHRRAGAVPLHARQLPERLPRPLVDLPPVLGVRHRRGVEPALPLPARAGRHRALGRARPAHAVSASTPTTPTSRGRSAGSAWRSTRSATRRSCSTGSRSTGSSTSFTINGTAAILLAFYVAAAEKTGVAARGAARHDPERHPQGVRGARHLDLAARSRRCG